MDTDGYYLLVIIILSCIARKTTDKLVLFIFYKKFYLNECGFATFIYTSEVQPSRLHYTDELMQIWNHEPKKRNVIDKQYILFYCLYTYVWFSELREWWKRYLCLKDYLIQTTYLLPPVHCQINITIDRVVLCNCIYHLKYA